MQNTMLYFVHYKNIFDPFMKTEVALVWGRGFMPVSSIANCYNELLFLPLSEKV